MIIKLITIVILFGLFGSVEAFDIEPLSNKNYFFSKDYTRAIEAYQKNNFDLASQLLPPYAEQGDTEALYALARMYENGWGVFKNLDKAKDYYIRSAQQGHPAAKIMVSSNRWLQPEPPPPPKKPAKPAVVLTAHPPTQSSNNYKPRSPAWLDEKPKELEIPAGTRAWLEKNPWFMAGENKKAAELAIKIDADLQKEGYSPENPIMYVLLNRRLKYIMPNLVLGEIYIPDSHNSNTTSSAYSSPVVTPPKTVTVSQAPKTQEQISVPTISDKSNKPLNSTADHSASSQESEISLMEAFFNICLNILIYISIPATIRYVILRRPLEKKWVAIVILIPIFAVFSMLINVHKREAIGKIYQQAGLSPDSYTPKGVGSPFLYAAMIVSYFILTSGSRKKKSETSNKETSSPTNEEKLPPDLLKASESKVLSESKKPTVFSMNSRQKILLQAIAAIIVGMLIYPPFQYILNNGRRSNAGYDWIFSFNNGAVVDIGMLISQWIGVLFVGIIIYLSLKSEK